MMAKMMSKATIEKSKIEETYKNMAREAFTVLNFVEKLERLYHEDWNDWPTIKRNLTLKTKVGAEDSYQEPS